MARRPIRLAELAEVLDREVEGDAEALIGDVAALEEAGPTDLSYVRSERQAPRLAASKAGAVILPPGVESGGRPTIRSPHPALDFARAARRIVEVPVVPPGVHARAHVDEEAVVDPTASIGPGCAVGSGCAVGPRSVLHPNVTLYDGVRLGEDCVIHAGCVLRERTELGHRVVLRPGVVLGGDGFGYVIGESGSFEPVPQVGRVVVENDVEIGANTTVDRGTLGETRIRRNTKIDNLVQIAHNCDIGEDVVVVAQAGIAGSATLERGALIMSQAGIPDHVTIGTRAYVGPKSGVHRDVPAHTQVMGYPHREMASFQRIWASLRFLPGLVSRVRAIERKLSLRGGHRRDEES